MCARHSRNNKTLAELVEAPHQSDTEAAAEPERPARKKLLTYLREVAALAD
jgi:hypothetical protein